jgi:hypothetical protein
MAPLPFGGGLVHTTAYAEIPTYGDDLSKPIYETVHHPATYKNETRYIDAILDPTIFVQGVSTRYPNL